MKNQLIDGLWGQRITNQKQKAAAAAMVVKRLKKGDVVGVGSGSTSFITLKALVQRRGSKGLDFLAIPTSIEMEMACAALSVPTTSLLSATPDWSFDGADEVDAKGNMIKGRGGAMLREKLIIKSSPEVYIVIDPSKKVRRLGQNFPVPVEVQPLAFQLASQAIEKMPNVTKVVLRQAVGKDGPVITEGGNLILDVSFNKIVDSTEAKLKGVVGVIESGLFIGYKPRIIISK